MYDGRFVIELVSGVPVVAAPDEIDMANARELGLALLEAAADGPGTLVADMGRTQYCDSSGIHTAQAKQSSVEAMEFTMTASFLKRVRKNSYRTIAPSL